MKAPFNELQHSPGAGSLRGRRLARTLALGSLFDMEDRFGHRVSYLRVSITDRCNERCLYCMPQELQEWLPRAEVLNFDEITRLTRIASELGVNKIRITGGEPLTRRDVLTLFRQLSKLERITDIGISTNGSLLGKPADGGETLARALAKLRVRTANISLDTLNPETFCAITGRDLLEQTLEGIAAAKAAGFKKVKLNAVLMRGRNEEEIGDLVRFARDEDLLLRFIELMPVSTTDVLTEKNFFLFFYARRRFVAQFRPLFF